MRDDQEIMASLVAQQMTVTQQIRNPKQWTVRKLIGPRPERGKLHLEHFGSVEEFKAAVDELRNAEKHVKNWWDG